MGFKSKLHKTLPDVHGSQGSHAFGLAASTTWGPPMDCGSAALLGVQARMYMIPIYLPRKMQPFNLQCEVTVVGTAGAEVRLGLYECNMVPVPFSGFLGRPSNLLFEGTVATTTTGLKNVGFPSVPDFPIFSEGVYWLVLAPQGAPATQATFRATTGQNPLMGGVNFLAGGIAGRRANGPAGAFPPVFNLGLAAQESPCPAVLFDVNQWY